MTEKELKLKIANEFADKLLCELGYAFVTSHRCVGEAIDEILKQYESEVKQ